jgi:hypothetical protein
MGGSFFCDAQPLLSPDDMLGCGPRPGDEAHEAARVHHPSRRRSSHLAARGVGAADGHAGDRLHERSVARRVGQSLERVRNGLAEHRWAEGRFDHLPALASDPRSPRSRSDRCHRWPCSSASRRHRRAQWNRAGRSTACAGTHILPLPHPSRWGTNEAPSSRSPPSSD